MLTFALASFISLQVSPREPVLAARILELFHAAFTSSDERREDAAIAEARQLFRERGIPTIDTVGDEPAYEFVVLVCSSGPMDFRSEVLSKARTALEKRTLPADAAFYCAARIRHDRSTLEASRRTPGNPALRDQINRLYETDAGRSAAASLMAIFERYGVPSYALVGPVAASNYAIMIQHQSPEFRSKVLPRLKANVDAGQGNPMAYAMMYDRARRDGGRKQLYGEQLECNLGSPLRVAPIEDEAHVDMRRARLGLMRLALHARLVAENSPALCSSP